MLRILFCLVTGIALTGCHQSPSYAKLFNTGALESQTLSIDNSRDTVVRTAKGALLKIDKGSFSGEGMVQVEVKEAYSLVDIVKGGLLTRSGDKTLTSGGMIYIGAVDKNLKMVKTIGVSIPTETIDPGMQLYKGEESEKGIEWTAPAPLPLHKTLATGKALFEQNCASCHAVDKALTGPRLANFEQRGPWKERKELYAFIHNPAAYMTTSSYSQCQQHQYGSIMPAFPQMDEDAIDAITEYVKSETLASGIPFPKDADVKCEDSCRAYELLVRDYYKSKLERQVFIDGNGRRILYDPQVPSAAMGRNSNAADIPDRTDKVVPVDYKAIYYRFEIQSFGWYNVDRLLDFNNGQEAELIVKIDENRTKEFDVFIAIPQYRVFDRGGLLKDQNGGYGFYTTDGKIPLPVGTKVYVFALSEAGGEILFDYKVFIAKAAQEILLKPAAISKEQLNSLVASFSLTDISFEAKTAKNADAIKQKDQEIKTAEEAIESLRPKNCECPCEDESDRPVDTLTSPVT